MRDFDEVGLGIIAIGASRVASASREGAEYQRQQLNLLRRHQGLPPIPPTYSGPSYWVIGWLGGSVLATIGLVLPIVLFPTKEITLWQGIASVVLALVGFFGLAGYLEVLKDRRREEFYEDWERAGCP